MDIYDKIDIVKRPPTEEIVTEEELKTLFENVSQPKHYIGLEISGLLHLGSLIIIGFKINDLIKAGVKCKIFLADWHSYINNKFEGDLSKIDRASKYYEAAFKFFCPGVEVVKGSNLYTEKEDYWNNLIRFSKNISLSRNVRCLTILGRSEKDKLDFAQYLYPPMQAVDIKAMDLDIAHAGMDQRKVHMLVRDTFPKLKWKTPVVLHHHLLPGLSEPVSSGIDENAQDDLLISSKMSKSKPWTCVFIHDIGEEVREKIGKAWCPQGLVRNNPVLEIAKYISFHESNNFTVDRPSKFGGPLTFSSYEDLEKSFEAKTIHPIDLKTAVSESVNKIITPVREYFKANGDLLGVYHDEKTK